MESFITLRVPPNSRVADIAKAAVEQANRTLEPVAFRFNGVLGIAMPGDSIDGVLDDWAVDFMAIA